MYSAMHYLIGKGVYHPLGAIRMLKFVFIKYFIFFVLNFLEATTKSISPSDDIAHKPLLCLLYFDDFFQCSSANHSSKNIKSSHPSLLNFLSPNSVIPLKHTFKPRTVNYFSGGLVMLGQDMPDVPFSLFYSFRIVKHFMNCSSGHFILQMELDIFRWHLIYVSTHRKSFI